MGLLDRVRSWLQRGDGAAESDEGAADGPPSGSTEPSSYECAACGTTVEDLDATCPVCRSGDIVPAGDVSRSAGPERATPNRHVEESSDDPSQRLQQVRDSSEILSEHPDHWEELDGGFRVETPDGEVTVTSRVEVAALLEDHYK